MSISILINGKPHQAQPGTTLLQACWEAGVYVPVLCAHPNLPTLGKCGECGICLVEDSLRKEPLLACCTPIVQNMTITTESALLQELRKACLSKILAEHPHVCLTCPHRDGCDRIECTLGIDLLERCCERFGTCEIQRVADDIGIPPETPRYHPKKLPSWSQDPVIRLDLDRCIACQRCVIACQDVMGYHALASYSINNRLLVRPSKNSLDSLELGFKESGCKFCGACVEVCPAGAILEQGKHGKRWREKTQTKLKFTPPLLPPRKTYTFNHATLLLVPDEPGVYRLWDEGGNVILIEGSPGLQKSLKQEMEIRKNVSSYDFEVAALYTQRANELLQNHLKKYGKLPMGNDLTDDLYC